MIYFDNSATTKPSKACIRAMTEAMETRFANASSIHAAGVAAKSDLDRCRSALARKLGSSTDEVLLTCGGTFSNNLAIHSAVTALRRRGNKIVVSSIEHPSVLECVKEYEKQGITVSLCHPDVESFKKEIDENTILVSCMLVNNETGLILPAGELKSIIRRAGSPALLHIDAVQAFGKIDVNVKKLDCDMLTVSAHKINGPKGAGALYVRKGVRVIPVTFGGEQENSLVPGTYNSPTFAGFAAAVEELSGKDPGYLKSLYDHFVSRADEYGFIGINSFGGQAPHIINVSFDGYLGENILHYLEGFEIYASQGSACSSHSKQKGRVLTALGADRKTADCSLRISFDYNNTITDIDEFFKVCSSIPEKIIKYYK